MFLWQVFNRFFFLKIRKQTKNLHLQNSRVNERRVNKTSAPGHSSDHVVEPEPVYVAVSLVTPGRISGE